MHKYLQFLLSSSLLLSSSMLWAQSKQQILIQAQKNPVTVQQAKTLKDATAVSLTGKIVKQINPKSDEFEFKDNTGKIILDIDDDLWEKHALKAGDHVRVSGEVDTHRSKPTDIEVIHLEHMQR